MARRANINNSIDKLLNDCETIPEDLMDSLENLNEYCRPYMARLARKELRAHGEIFLSGLLSDLERKSVEPIAERAGRDR